MRPLTLYHAELSPCAHKVRLALEERNIAFESRLLNLMGKENLTSDYLKINPKGVVPALVHGEIIITESTVICEYLEDAFSQKPLMPQTPIDKARVRYWTKHVDELLHPNTMPIIFGGLARYVWLAKPEEERSKLLAQIPDPLRRQRQTRLIKQGLAAPDVLPAIKVWQQTFKMMEAKLSERQWLAGDNLTLADYALTPYIFAMKYLQVEFVFNQYPHLHQWMQHIMERPAFDAAIKPYVKEQQWQMIATVAEKTGPTLGAMFAS